MSGYPLGGSHPRLQGRVRIIVDYKLTRLGRILCVGGSMKYFLEISLRMRLAKAM